MNNEEQVTERYNNTIYGRFGGADKFIEKLSRQTQKFMIMVTPRELVWEWD